MVRATLLLLGYLFLLPNGAAYACSACVMSMVNLMFPFMWEAVWVLAIWRIIYLYFQLNSIEKRSVLSLCRELAILGFLFLTFASACFFVYLVGVFLIALFKSLRNLTTVRKQKLPRLALISHGVTILILVPLAASAYATFAKQDDLDRLRHYVYPGTGQSRHLAMAIGKDSSLDLKRIRWMLESPDDHESEKAFEVLRARNRAGDLIAFKDIVLDIPESEYSLETYSSRRTNVWLPIWLHSVTGKDIATKDELKAWISEAEKLSSTDTENLHRG